jgi:hypothetical protein
LTSLPAFDAFQSGIRDRALEPPEPAEAVIVGNYNLLA